MKRLIARTLQLGAVLALCGAAGVPAALAQSQVYRCGNEYTNQIKGRTDCKPLVGGNITIVRGTSPMGSGAASGTARSGGSAAPGAQAAVPGAVQRERDADRKAILERELARAQRHQADLEAEYKGGEPDKIGGEAHNYQKYLDRVADLKAAIARNQSDIEGIQRELNRVGN